MKTQRKASYTSEEVAELLQVSIWSVYRMRESGRIKPLNLGLRSVRYAREEIDALVAGKYVEASTEKAGAL